MHFSTGWIWLIGGVIGTIRNATAKKYRNSDFNHEFFETEEERNIEVFVSPRMRWGIVASCVLVALVGVWLIQRDGNWNPFQGS
jgi:hypothetical protein